MAQTFRIATAEKADRFTILGESSKVSEELFYKTLSDKVKEITADYPEKFDEALDTVKNHLKTQGVTVVDTFFEIKGKN